MGANLSSTQVVDTSKDVLHPSDVTAITILGIAWLCSAYGIGMIWTVMALIDRWRGPHGDRPISFATVVAALLLSAAWPLVLIALLMN
ncbi:hypothetical protein NKR23_g6189 [Pleurostoma richardsiae]|uniref:Uncharacterized protein n=1 Tax=Pleurostoma richardsiae TaxID=41990 RepID=A0AA38RRI8_9PEZI|nr:hypothetical protein NKR23_g6189 [Pleurostoma richardsiae]